VCVSILFVGAWWNDGLAGVYVPTLVYRIVHGSTDLKHTYATVKRAIAVPCCPLPFSLYPLVSCVRLWQLQLLPLPAAHPKVLGSFLTRAHVHAYTLRTCTTHKWCRGQAEGVPAGQPCVLLSIVEEHCERHSDAGEVDGMGLVCGCEGGGGRESITHHNQHTRVFKN
jgi:hypothetical protein